MHSITQTQKILTFTSQTGERQQQKHIQHAPSMKMECGYLYGWIKKQRSYTQKIHQKWWSEEICWEHRRRNRRSNRKGVMGPNSSLVVCWACCPALCSVVGSIFLWGEFFPVKGIFPLELTWVLTPLTQNSFGWEYKPRSSLSTHAFHHTDSKDPDIHVLDGWMPATNTRSACTIHENRMWLPQWLD